MKDSSSGHSCVPGVDSVHNEYSVCFPLSFACIPLVVEGQHPYFNSNHNSISEILE